MKRLLEKLTKTNSESNLLYDFIIAFPRLFCGLTLAFGFGASKFGMLWTPAESNLSLFQVSNWFVEDVSKFGGLFSTFPILFAWLAAGTEAIGGLCLALGLKTRLFSFFLMITMLVAVFFQKWDSGLWAMLPALGFLWVSLYTLVLGSGRFGIDYLIYKKLENDRVLTTPINQLKLNKK